MTLKQQRTVPDLVTMIAQLQSRVDALETAKRLGNSSLDSNELTVRGGDINVRSDNDNLVTKIQHGVLPTIQYFPGDIEVPTKRTSMFGWLAGDGAALQASCEDISPGQQNGGKLLLLPNGLYLSVQRPAKPEAYFAIATQSGYPEHFRFQGRWVNNDQFAANDAVIFGQTTVGAGFGAAGFSFIYPFDQTPVVLYSLQSAGTAVAHDLSALDNTGFTVAWATGTTAKVITWAAFRV